MPLLFFLPILILFVAPIVIGAILLFSLIFKGITKQKNSKGEIFPTKTK